MNELDSSAQAMGRQEEALIRLAVDSALLLPNLFAILEKFEQQFPATDIELVSSTSLDIFESIEQGNADIGLAFVEFDFKREVELGYIGGLDFHPVCHPQQPLAKLKEISAAELLPHRQIMPRSAKGGAPTQLPLLSAKTWYCNNYQAIHALLEKQVGWAYLVEQDLKQGKLKKLKFTFDHKPWVLSIEMIRQKNTVMGPAQTWLYDELKQLLNHH